MAVGPEVIVAKQSEGKGKAKVQFTDAELDALRTIVADWVNEQVVAPPYPPEIASIIEKLGIVEEEAEEVEAAVAAAPARDVARPFQMDNVPSSG
jgi:hypothetical protein